MKGKLVLITLLILFPISCKALSCNYNEQARLRRLASNVTTSYEYVEDGDKVSFNVTLTNVTNEIYIRDNNTGNEYRFNDTNEIVINGYEPGLNIRYMIYPVKENCTYSYLASKYVNLPYYNKYYKDPLCEGKNYSICGKWQKVTLSYDEFVKTINEYSKKENQNEEIKEEKDNVFDMISKFIFDYYIFILGGGLLIFVLISFLRRNKDQFDL